MEALGKDVKVSKKLWCQKMLEIFFLGRGMSRASKRAKEHQNRSSDELGMAETKISRSQFLLVADVR